MIDDGGDRAGGFRVEEDGYRDDQRRDQADEEAALAFAEFIDHGLTPGGSGGAGAMPGGNMRRGAPEGGPTGSCIGAAGG